MEKDSRYAFRVNKDIKEKFKIYCKIVGVSPSDILTEVMSNFNDDVDRIIAMQSADELMDMLKGKFSRAELEICRLLEEKKIQQ